MNNMSDKDKADQIRFDIAQLSDEQLLNFTAAVRGGDDITGEPFDYVTEFIIRVANDFKSKMPF